MQLRCTTTIKKAHKPWFINFSSSIRRTRYCVINTTSRRSNSAFLRHRRGRWVRRNIGSSANVALCGQICCCHSEQRKYVHKQRKQQSIVSLNTETGRTIADFVSGTAPSKILIYIFWARMSFSCLDKLEIFKLHPFNLLCVKRCATIVQLGL